MVIPNGVDPSRIQPVDRRDARQRLGVAPDAFVILSMGALVPEKEPMAHVRVGSAALQSLPNAVHLIAGDGSLFADLEHAIQRSGQAGRMLMLGSRDDVPALLAASDVVLFLSRSSGMEGMPAVAIEAGMSGRSFVGYDVAGVSEVVLNETTGLLVRESDESSVVEALVRLSQDDALRARLGGAARTRCLGSFDIAAVADRYANAYRMAMDARHAA
jgi:glycosyltransferase involved in cell wall biosynthesis